MFNKKRILSIVLTLVLVLGLVLGTVGQIVFAEGTTKITLVHLNDIHGRVKEDEREGAIGFSKLKTKIDLLREENPNLLLLNAGDTIHGTTLVNVTEGETMIKLMNEIGFDAMTPGNHDFNYGYERLVELKDMADFPIISANLVEEDSKKEIFKPYIIKEIDGVKLGIFGATTEETKFKSHPKNTEGVDFINPVDASRDAVKQLEKENVDIIIGLVHLGVEGTTLTTAKDIIENVDGIDILIDGHSHEETNEKIKDTLLVQAGSYTKNIGILDLEVKDGEIVKAKETLFPYEEAKKLEENKEILKEVEKIDEINRPILDVVVGETKVDLDGERENVRTRETNLGNLIADTMLESAKGDIAFTNGGGIRASIKKGQVKVNDIITTVPFTNTLAVIEASGAEIVKALERGVDSYPEQAGHFPQLAGLKFSFDPEQKVGERVILDSVMVNDSKIDLDKKYRVVTNDFIAAGGDGYTMFEGKAFVGEGGLLSDLLREKFQTAKTVAPEVEARITVKTAADPMPMPIGVKVTLNGEKINFNKDLGFPFIDENNRTLVPVRLISETLGHKVLWDGKARTVKIDKNISLKVGDKFVTVDGKKVEMDTRAIISKEDNRTYVPLKFVSEALGYEVKWEQKTRTANIIKLVEPREEAKPAA